MNQKSSNGPTIHGGGGAGNTLLRNLSLNRDPDFSATKSLKKFVENGLKRLWMWYYFDGGYLFVVWLLMNIIIFSYMFYHYGYSGLYSKLMSIVGIALPIARGCAGALDLNFGLILFSVSLRFLTFLSNFSYFRALVDLNNHKRAHKIMGISIVFFGLTHSVAHVINDIRLSSHLGVPFSSVFYGTASTLTGNVVLICILILAATSIPQIRRKYFNIFIGFHQLYIVIFAVMLFHGAFCFIQADDEPKCGSGPMFWKFALPSIIIFSLDKILAAISLSKPVKIKAVVEKPNDTLEIRFSKPELIKNGVYNYKSGQYLFLCVPGVSRFQKHPFTICTAPEDDYISVNISCHGDWTKSIKKFLHHAATSGMGNSVVSRSSHVSHLPNIYMEGPYTAPADEAFHYETLLLVGGGIGVTPFASIMKSFVYKVKQARNFKGKIYFVWISRSAENFGWFYDLLSEIEDIDTTRVIDISLYWTVKKVTPSFVYKISHENSDRDPVTKLRYAKTYYGRPRWDQIFDSIETRHKGSDVGVFYCGPKPLAVTLDQLSRNRTGETNFHFHKEIF